MARPDFVKAAASEKIVLAHVQGSARLYNWVIDSGARYKKQVPYFPVNLKKELAEIEQVFSIGDVVDDTWFYDIDGGIVYCQLSGTTPADEEMIVTYRFFYATGPADLSWDLTDSGRHVHYDGRITLSPGYKHKIAVEQNLTSVIGNGSLKLHNTDGALDEIYDTIVFDNHDVKIYSWGRGLDFSEAKIIYRGKITGKRFQPDNVNFSVKDEIYVLEQNVPQGVYTTDDGVNSSIAGRYKRWIYGKVAGLRLQSVDQIGEGYQISGTASVFAQSKGRIKIQPTDPTPANYNSTIATPKYTVIPRPEGRTWYYLWFDYNNTGDDPANTVTSLAEYTGRRIDLNGSDTINSIITKINNEFDDVYTVLTPGGSFSLLEEGAYGSIPASITNANAAVTASIAFTGVDGNRLNGTGTSFLQELSPEDELKVGTQTFTIRKVDSDTIAWLNKIPDYLFNNQPMLLIPEIPTRTKNRRFQVADHACAKLVKTLVSIPQLNRVELSDTDGLIAGDFIEFSTGARIEIKRIAPGNVAVLRKSIAALPPIGSDVIRQPVQVVYALKETVFSDDYTIDNTSAGCFIDLTEDAEFNIADTENLNVDLAFTNGSRVVTYTGTQSLPELFSSRDWVQPLDPLFSTWYEILSVGTNQIILRSPFTDPTHTGAIVAKRPEYIGDNTAISATVLGRTKNNTPTGEWITSGAAAVRDLVAQSGITEVNEISFTAAEQDAKALISMALPFEPQNRGVKVKAAIDVINKTVVGSLTLDNDLLLKYKILDAQMPNDALEISDFDVFDWSIESTNGKNIRSNNIFYRKQDVVRETQEDGTKLAFYESDFVAKYVGTNQLQELDVYLYDDKAAEIMSHRNLYLQTLARNDLTLSTDLRLENIEIGDTVIINFRRLYKRLGDAVSRKKAMIVIGKDLDGKVTKLQLSDVGNILNRSSIITPNDAPDYSAASELEKIKYGYITQNDGIVDNDEDSAGVHLIS